MRKAERHARIVTVSVINSAGIDALRRTLVWGLPLPRGRVKDVRALRLRAKDERRLPVQCDAQARWPDGSVKWGLLTVPGLRVGAQQKTKLTLESGPAVPRPGILVRETAGGLRVNTGALRFVVRKQGSIAGDFFCRARDRWTKRADRLDLVMEVERAGKLTAYRAALEPSRRLQVESLGPFRAVIAVRGAHGAADGRMFGPYVLRFEVHAGSNALRLTHSVVFDGDPDRDFVRRSELILQAAVGGGRRFAFGTDAGHEVRFERQRAAWLPDFRYAELYQDSATHFRVRRWVDLKRRAVFCEEGLQSDGWMELAGSRGSVDSRN